MSELTLDIPEAWWMSSNDRMHWAPKMERTGYVRHMAALLARAHHLPAFHVAQVTVWVQYPHAGKADPANAAPTVKAAIDGLVDAGVFPDDDHKRVLGPDYRREVGRTLVKGMHRLRFVITDQEVKW